MEENLAQQALRTTYTCGQCAEVVAIGPRDAVRCRRCGHRILYKIAPATKPRSYEAR